MISQHVFWILKHPNLQNFVNAAWSVSTTTQSTSGLSTRHTQTPESLCVAQIKLGASIGGRVMQLMYASVLEAFPAQSGVNSRESRKQRKQCLQAHVLISEIIPIKQIMGGNTRHDGRQKTKVLRGHAAGTKPHCVQSEAKCGCFFSVQLNGQSGI